MFGAILPSIRAGVRESCARRTPAADGLEPSGNHEERSPDPVVTTAAEPSQCRPRLLELGDQQRFRGRGLMSLLLEPTFELANFHLGDLSEPTFLGNRSVHCRDELGHPRVLG